MLMAMGAEDVHIREHALPGIGRRFDLDVGDGLTLVVVTRRDGSRDIAVRERDADEPRRSVHLRREQAVAIGSLLLGARFSMEDPGGEDDQPGVDVATVVLGDASPAVGQLPGEVDLPRGAEAAVVAVARDDTPQLLEDDRIRLLEPGDRLVVAARPEHLDEVLHHLAG
jgi:TrkA domain protein